jgi:hypothetical protein
MPANAVLGACCAIIAVSAASSFTGRTTEMRAKRPQKRLEETAQHAHPVSSSKLMLIVQSVLRPHKILRFFHVDIDFAISA